MCYFVTLGINAASVDKLTEAASQLPHIYISRAGNKSVAASFPSSDRLFYVTDHHCSCSIAAMSSQEEMRTAQSSSEDRFRERNKSWSSSKIERALSDKRKSQKAGRKRSVEELEFCELVSLLVSEIGSVRLFSQMYSGNPESEKIDALTQERLTDEEFRLNGGGFEKRRVFDVVASTS
jgi:hypothetical protein